MRLPRIRPLVITAILLAAGFLAGRTCAPEAPAPSSSSPSAAAAAEPTVWTCSMHPQIRLPAPGKCPICFMDLIPAESGQHQEEDLGPRSLQMTEAAMRLAEIETAPVERRSVAHEVRMVGKVAFDETRVAYITAWVAGRLDRLFVDYTGVKVRPGDHLVEIYSPALYSAQQELLQAIATAKKLEKSSLEVLRTTTDRTVASSREKLRLLGLTETQIQDVVQRGVPDEHVTILAPAGGIVVHKNALEGMYVDEGTRIYTIADLTKVWVLLDAYESDIAWLRYGQDVEFRVEAYPGEKFHGRVAFIDPVLDDHTRTVKVRLNVENPELRLKPDMFVSAHAEAVLTPEGQVVDERLAGKWMCPMHPEVLADGPGTCPECGMDLAPVTELGFSVHADEGPSLVIPATAPLITGKRAVVYVRLPGHEQPTFEGRVVTLGPRAGDWYVVRDGLAEGERVVVKGNFKIDSELQIRAKPSMMSPEGGAPPPGHHHAGAGGHAGAPSSGQTPKAAPRHGEARVPASGEASSAEEPASDTEPSPGGESLSGKEAAAGEEPALEGAPVGAKSTGVPEPFRAQLGTLAEAYLALHADLFADGDGSAAGRALAEALEHVDAQLLEAGERATWTKMRSDLATSIATLQSAADRDAGLAALAPLTEALARVLDTFGYQREGGDLALFHCPMALDDGADWIQAAGTTQNPYFGSAMPRCGSLTRALRQEP